MMQTEAVCFSPLRQQIKSHDECLSFLCVNLPFCIDVSAAPGNLPAFCLVTTAVCSKSRQKANSVAKGTDL